MDKDFRNFVTGLMELGLTERESKVYLALLYKNPATISDLMDLSGVRQGKIYDVVSGLLRNGFCTERKVGRKRTFDLVNPENSLRPFQEILNKKVKNADILVKSLTEKFESNEKVQSPSEYIEILHGNETIHRGYLNLFRNTKEEVLNFTRPPFASMNRDMHDEQMEILDKFIKNGGRVRGVFEVNEDSIPDMFLVCKDCYELGEDFRIAPNIPLKMFIFDREVLLIADKSRFATGTKMSMTVIKQKISVDGYIALFDFFWEQGQPYEEWIIGKEELMERKLAEMENLQLVSE